MRTSKPNLNYISRSEQIIITSLIHEGFSPPTIEETIDISGIEQNCLSVGAQVHSNAYPDVLASFETSGFELLYEIRLLNTSERIAASSVPRSAWPPPQRL
ncbi:hypothetical protein Fmac_031473 [Flemingia macrophylla]|uniref:Rubisco accumulation factor 1 helix turn helix domain-containing protein n=1 Tax=Flemingia macrophylla TaxID=520843 RepID=A0ABD1L249_9FABA